VEGAAPARHCPASAAAGIAAEAPRSVADGQEAAAVVVEAAADEAPPDWVQVAAAAEPALAAQPDVAAAGRDQEAAVGRGRCRPPAGFAEFVQLADDVISREHQHERVAIAFDRERGVAVVSNPEFLRE